jgi:hypothetical protein
MEDERETKKKRLSLACNVCRRKKVIIFQREYLPVKLIKRDYNRLSVMELNQLVENVKSLIKSVHIRQISKREDLDKGISNY